MACCTSWQRGASIANGFQALARELRLGYVLVEASNLELASSHLEILSSPDVTEDGLSSLVDPVLVERVTP